MYFINVIIELQNYHPGFRNLLCSNSSIVHLVKCTKSWHNTKLMKLQHCGTRCTCVTHLRDTSHRMQNVWESTDWTVIERLGWAGPCTYLCVVNNVQCAAPATMTKSQRSISCFAEDVNVCVYVVSPPSLHYYVNVYGLSVTVTHLDLLSINIPSVDTPQAPLHIVNLHCCNCNGRVQRQFRTTWECENYCTTLCNLYPLRSPEHNIESCGWSFRYFFTLRVLRIRRASESRKHLKRNPRIKKCKQESRGVYGGNGNCRHKLRFDGKYRNVCKTNQDCGFTHKCLFIGCGMRLRFHWSKIGWR